MVNKNFAKICSFSTKVSASFKYFEKITIDNNKTDVPSGLTAPSKDLMKILLKSIE